jgi:hypothetical protein
MILLSALLLLSLLVSESARAYSCRANACRSMRCILNSLQPILQVFNLKVDSDITPHEENSWGVLA